MDMDKKVILTGIRANNNLTLGNYLGAMLPIIEMAKSRSDNYQVNMFIPDLHSFTTPIDHSKLYEQIIDTARLFIAAGLPTKSANILMYRQSYIPAHSELTWILDCFTGMGELSRMTQYKDKSAGSADDRITVGLFNYPVLMAADILLYNASYIPVGDDQTQHLEFTRDIAEKFNAKFGNIFTLPAPLKSQREFFSQVKGIRIKDLVDPSKKMSKSDESNKGVIFLSDTPAEVKKKIMSATTDSIGVINYDHENQPGISNLLEIYSMVSGKDIKNISAEFTGKTNYGELKKAVADEVIRLIEDLQSKLDKISKAQAVEFLEFSEKAANNEANSILLNAQIAVGLRSKAK
jgi:tryptophanyl-tRNA synthetase